MTVEEIKQINGMKEDEDTLELEDGTVLTLDDLMEMYSPIDWEDDLHVHSVPEGKEVYSI